MAISITDQGSGVYWKLATSAVGVTTLTNQYSVANTAGSLLVAVIGSGTASSMFGSLTVEDDVNGSWTVIEGADIGVSVVNRSVAIAYKQNCASGTPTVTITGGSGTYALWIAEVKNIDTTAALEGQTESSASGAGDIVMDNQTISIAGTAFVVSACVRYPGATIDAYTGFTKRYDATPGNLTTYPYSIQDNTAGTGTQAVEWGDIAEAQTYWAGVAAAFKEAAGGSIVPQAMAHFSARHRR